MRTPSPLPSSLGVRFRVDEARAAGASPSRIRTSDLRTPYFGARSSVPADDVHSRCAEFVPVMAAHQFFSHITAAQLWDIPLPSWFADSPLHVSAPSGAREPRDASIIGHRLHVANEHVVTVRGLPVASPAETWCQLGGRLALDDLVAAGDFLIGRGGLAEPRDLLAALRRVRRAGAVTLREALPLLRPEPESSPESRLRIALLVAGLPQPELQWTLRTPSGAFVARLDLAFPEYRVGVEYDGRHHADHTQFVRDADRWALIADQGWTIVRVLAHHLADGSAPSRVSRALRHVSHG